jgi:hypothetical protein
MVLQRGTFIAVLVGVEIALVFMMAQAVNPAFRTPWQMQTYHDLQQTFGTAGAGSPSSLGTKYAFTVGAQPEVTVDIGYADLTIERGNDAHVSVDVPRHGWHGIGASAPAITARQDGDRILVAEAERSGWTVSDDRRVRITVTPGTRLIVQNAGNIDASGLRATASFSSNNGYVTITDFNAPSLTVETSNGRVNLRDVTAPSFEVSSSNGRIEGSALHVTNGHVKSSNGRVTLGFAANSDTTVTAETSNGSVDVGNLNVTSAAHATAHQRSSDDDDDDDDGDGSSKTIRLGSGSGQLDVHSSNGNINLRQEG